MSTRPIQIRKHDLTIKLQRVNPHPRPKVALEQYTIPADLAAEILFTACYVHDDIEGKFILDLGTGTGRLALGAAILGAGYVVGIDIDPVSVSAASKSSEILDADVDWVLGNIETIRGHAQTVLMNPPFGTKQPHADIQFLQCGLDLGDVVYSIHKSSTREFLNGWLQEKGFQCERITNTKMEIKHQFPFHRKPRGFVEVDVLRIEAS
jgi:putative methylase